MLYYLENGVISLSNSSFTVLGLILLLQVLINMTFISFYTQYGAWEYYTPSSHLTKKGQISLIKI